MDALSGTEKWQNNNIPTMKILCNNVLAYKFLRIKSIQYT